MDQKLSLVLLVAIALLVMPNTSQGCVTRMAPDLRDILLADVVLIGKVQEYKIIKSRFGGLMDYAQFEIRTVRSLHGDAPDVISVTWDNSTFSEPKDFDKTNDYIFALRHPSSTMPPLRGAGTVPPSLESEKLTILQAPCASPLIFRSEEEIVEAISKIFDGEGDPSLEAQKANKLAKPPELF